MENHNGELFITQYAVITEGNTHYINEYKRDEIGTIVYKDTILESDDIELLNLICDQLVTGTLKPGGSNNGK